MAATQWTAIPLAILAPIVCRKFCESICHGPFHCHCRDHCDHAHAARVFADGILRHCIDDAQYSMAEKVLRALKPLEDATVVIRPTADGAFVLEVMQSGGVVHSIPCLVADARLATEMKMHSMGEPDDAIESASRDISLNGTPAAPAAAAPDSAAASTTAALSTPTPAAPRPHEHT